MRSVLKSVFCCCAIPVEVAVAGPGLQQVGNVWVTDYRNAGGNITITATTGLFEDVQWTDLSGAGAPDPNDADIYVVPINPGNVRPAGTQITITASAGGLDVDTVIEIKPAVNPLAVVAETYAFQDGGGWYAYNLALLPLMPGGAPVRTTNIRATVLPATAAALTHLRWAAVNTATGAAVALTVITAHAVHGIPLNATRNVQVTVDVPGSTQAAEQIAVNVIAPNNGANLANNLGVELDQVTFAGAGRFPVTQEDALNFNTDFGADWVRAPAAAPPQGYVADTVIALNAVAVNVTAQPTALTNLTVRANVYFTRPAAAPTVLTAATAATGVANGTVVNTVVALGNIALPANVPDEVMHQNPLMIFWEADNGGGWQPLAVTTNVIYVTALQPVAATDATLNSPGGFAPGPGIPGAVYTYHTLLDLSCAEANGLPVAAGGLAAAANMAAIKTRIYRVFQPAAGNADLQRQTPPGGGAALLTYWLDGNPAQTINGGGGTNLFTNGPGSIACGVFADMLVAMWALHGDGGARSIEVTISDPAVVYPGGFAAPGPILVGTSNFMVRAWDYNNHGALNNANYTHDRIAAPPLAVGMGAPDEVVALGSPGQNNAAAPIGFFNHYIVRDGIAGNFYDPSYGTAPLARDAWVDASLAGIWDRWGADNAGFVVANGGLPNGIEMDHAAVALWDHVGGAWVP